MAYTVSHLMSTVMGDQRVIGARVTADAATGTWETGLGNVATINNALQSGASAPVMFAINEGVSGTAIAGLVAITGAASGDEFLITAYGT